MTSKTIPSSPTQLFSHLNTYLVPIISQQYTIPSYIIPTYAPTEKDAYTQAQLQQIPHSHKILSPAQIPYESYTGVLPIIKSHFTFPEKNDIIRNALRSLNISEEKIKMEMIDIYNYMYWGDYNAQIQDLADKALPEKWSFEDKDDNYILKNYLKYTFKKLYEENKIIETDNYCVFDTGLFSHYYESIYAYGELNKSDTPKWYFKGFKDKYELGALDIAKFPERADYLSDPSELVFNWHLPVNKNYNHILDDLNTSQRLPEDIKNCSRPLDMLKGVIDTAIQKVIANYKLAVPHYYQNKIQLLVPLCFGEDNKPDVALVLDKMKSGYYQATTCLSMEMAYMDARLITKPESNWLIAENIKEN